MNTVKRAIAYIKHLRIPLVWTFANCTVTLRPYLHDKLLLTSDHVNPDYQRVIFHEDDTIDLIVLAITKCTAATQNEDGTWESEVELVLERMEYLMHAPVDIDKVAGWLIEQYEAGNTEPLVDRVQVILSNMSDASMSFYEEDKQVCAYYQNKISRELYDNAFNAMYNARINIVKLSSMLPHHTKYKVDKTMTNLKTFKESLLKLGSEHTLEIGTVTYKLRVSQMLLLCTWECTSGATGRAMYSNASSLDEVVSYIRHVTNQLIPDGIQHITHNDAIARVRGMIPD